MSKPAFNPSLPFEVVEKPKFDPSKPFKETIFGYVDDKPQEKMSKEDVIGMIRSEIALSLRSIKPQEKIVEKIKEVPIEKKVIVVDEDKTKEVVKKYEDALAQLNMEKEKISQLMNQIRNIGGSGVIGLPKASGHDGKVLTVENGKAKWSTAIAGSGGLTAGTYSISNQTEDRDFDASSTSLDELANIVATLIADLGGL